jgi:Ring finger domain/B-box zinc finger
MAEISVFECGICFHRYNESDRLPLSLLCGHVFCKSCMKNLFASSSLCPIDKHKFPPSLDNLPCCYAILTNLPRGNLGVSCSRHPKKKVKFMCRIHTKYLCTECVLEHTGPGHEILAFTPNLDEMNKELQSLVEISQELIAEVKDNLKSQQQQDKKIANFYDSQILKVSTSYDAAIRNLSNKKRELIESLKKSMKEQIMTLELQRLKNNKKLESAVNWASDLKQVTNSLADISYEEFSAFLTMKKSELRNLTDSRSIGDVSIKYFVYNGKI